MDGYITQSNDVLKRTDKYLALFVTAVIALVVTLIGAVVKAAFF